MIGFNTKVCQYDFPLSVEFEAAEPAVCHRPREAGACYNPSGSLIKRISSPGLEVSRVSQTP